MSGSPDDPNWPRASAWLAGEHDSEPVARLGVLGAPLHLGSLSGARCDLAPAAVRRALARYSTWSGWPVWDVRPVEVRDAGDVPVGDLSPEDAFGPLAAAVREAHAGVDAVAILGGDNSVTRPAMHGLGLPLARVGLLTLDAHFDLRDLAGGLSNGNPVRALLADGLPGRNVAQIGIQPFANSGAYADVASNAGIRWVPVDEVLALGIIEVVARELGVLGDRVDAVYVDLDLDVLDRAAAPGTAGSRPGGLAARDLLRAAALCGREPKVRAVDIVEVDPERDVADVTVLTAASCLLAFASGLAARGEGRVP